MKIRPVDKTRRARQIYMTYEDQEKIPALLGKLAAEGVNIYDVHGVPSFGVAVKYLMYKELGEMEQIRTRVIQADLQRLDAQDKQVEVEYGEIIESESGVTFLHYIIIKNLLFMLDPFVKANKLGTVYGDGVRYILAGTVQDIERARKPDFSFLRAGRIPKDFDWLGDFVGAPDLAVEVASPGQTNTVLLPKIIRYLEAGSEEGWLIYPSRRVLYQYRRDAEEPVLYRDNDVVDTSVLFPGLKLVLADLFITETE